MLTKKDKSIGKILLAVWQLLHSPANATSSKVVVDACSKDGDNNKDKTEDTCNNIVETTLSCPQNW